MFYAVVMFVGVWIAACFPAAILVRLAGPDAWEPMIAILGFVFACGFVVYCNITRS